MIDELQYDSGLPGSGVQPHFTLEEEEIRKLYTDDNVVRTIFLHVYIRTEVSGVTVEVKNKPKQKSSTHL